MQNTPFPQRLRQARKKVGLSQKDLGIKVGMDEGSASGRMNHYEKGRHLPDIDMLKKIATELGVPLSYFFCEDELSAELVCLFELLDNESKLKLIKKLRTNN
ncbi:helix-turn-helix transcriptional regulator [Escherichia coli]|uniref:helix-turn-helix domain-containing protein n=1 Tax=Enterobacteriaceae TaxID=543 RepID=UPI000BE23B6F|nr:helix-turn-helix transcriptional regulator [Escherichia coli]EFC5452705.1 helix-turn-helix transcriptional regulator [Escherichia coli]EFC6549219.1 XRE family transcriptional regulator [Escherichia coli]EFH8976803.1 XRE family transcriptional regulator [Escherichia coli]EFH9411511.1 helix-turn-helix domain-containing protein [Escherichia coli]EFI4642367.1 helix-turn-helix transcriptional regulator [Escherichia coli]